MNPTTASVCVYVCVCVYGAARIFVKIIALHNVINIVIELIIAVTATPVQRIHLGENYR